MSEIISRILEQQNANNIKNLSKAASEYEWTTTNGQVTFVFPDAATYDVGSKWLSVNVGGGDVPDSLIQKDSSKQFTLLVDPSKMPAGLKVVARWTEPYVPAVSGHQLTHQKGGTDELDVTTLRNYTEQIANKISANTTVLGTAPLQTTAQTVREAINENKGKIDTNTNQIGNRSNLPPWLQDSLYNVAKMHDDYLRDIGLHVARPPYNAVFDGVTDITQQMNNIIADAVTKKLPIILPTGDGKITSTIQVNTRQLRFIGAYGAPTQYGANGTTFVYYGTGAMFQFGTDDGLAWDASSDYNGVQDCYFEHVRMVAAGTTTPLENGSGNYVAGTTAIKDWRGGSFALYDVAITSFDYGFWGIKSDFNSFHKLSIDHCHSAGIYLGPRSDQNTINELYTSFNDRALWLDRVSHTRFMNCQFVCDGSATTNPIKIGSAFSSSGTIGTLFEACWFERYVNGWSEAFVEIGVGDSVVSYDITFRDCILNTGVQGSSGYVKYFCKMGQARRINFENLINGNISSFKKLFYFVGTYPADIFVKLHNDYAAASLFDTDGQSTPNVAVYSFGGASLQFYTPNGRFAIRNNPTNTLRDYRFTSEYGDKTFAVDFYNTGDGNVNRILYKKRRVSSTSSPSNKVWDIGDIVYNESPTVGGTVGWTCTTAGTANNTAWAASTAYAVNQVVNANGKVYTCTVSGTSGSTPPSHTSGTATDGTVTWQYTDILAVFSSFGSVGTPSVLRPSLQNSWADFGGGYEGSGYYKTNDNIVRLQGLIKGGVVTSGTVIFNLPAGYRPTNTRLAPVTSNNGSAAVAGMLQIATNGDVTTFLNVNNNYLSLEGVSFKI